MNRELKQLLIRQQQEDERHIPFEDEYHFYRRIQQGDISVLEGNLSIEPMEGMGTLSSNPMRNKKYHLIILISMITRFCVEGGLDTETAYTLSDLLIRQIDQAENDKALQEIKKDAITQYTLAMQTQKNRHPYSLPVTRASDFIHAHVAEALTNQMVADHVSYHPDYLSHLFKKETGLSLSQYILEQKCHTACYMLENSNATCTSISAFLGFSSCSHFISRFKSIVKMTPTQYRQSKMRKNLSASSVTPPESSGRTITDHIL